MKCHDCKKRIWKSWQGWCSAGLENDNQLYDYHKKCFKRNHYREWKIIHPEEIVIVFNGQKVPKTGYYRIISHEEKCNKILQSEKSMFMTKGSIAHTPIMCKHDVEWEMIFDYG